MFRLTVHPSTDSLSHLFGESRLRDNALNIWGL